MKAFQIGRTYVSFDAHALQRLTGDGRPDDPAVTGSATASTAFLPFANDDGFGFAVVHRV